MKCSLNAYGIRNRVLSDSQPAGKSDPFPITAIYYRAENRVRRITTPASGFPTRSVKVKPQYFV